MTIKTCSPFKGIFAPDLLARWLSASTLSRKLIALLFIAFSVAPGAFGRSLLNSTDGNGSFEGGGTNPWRLRPLSGAVDHSMRLVGEEGGHTAADGENYLVVDLTNRDEAPSVVTLFTQVENPNMSDGRAFLVSWKARGRETAGFNETWARITFVPLDGEGNAEEFTSPKKSISHTEWTPHQFEAVYAGKTSLKAVVVTIGLERRSHNRSSMKTEGYLDDITLEQQTARETAPSTTAEKDLPKGRNGRAESASIDTQAPIPIEFQIEKPGYVTLVIDNDAGVRVKNLISAQFFDAGAHTIFWDGTDEGTSTVVPRSPGVQKIEPGIVSPGNYKVRGLVRDEIKLSYEFTVYPNVGDPPWITDLQSGTGGWLADHGVPTATLFLPSNQAPGGKDQVLLAAPVSEASQALAWVDLEGKKIAGRFRLGGRWTGADFLARDRGTARHPEIYAYTMKGWAQDTNPKQPEVRLMGLTKDAAITVGMIPHEPSADEGSAKNSVFLRGRGLAVHNAVLVYSVADPGTLHFYDVKLVSSAQRASHMGSIAVEDPRGIGFDVEGRLLVLSGTNILRHKVGFDEKGKPSLSEPEKLVSDGLEDPRAITIDDDGTIYVADWGDSHQVKVFSEDGAYVRAIGNPGKPATGIFDESHMNFPYGLSVSSDKKLWVASSAWRTPKTVSVWSLDGTHVKSFYGPSEYGGGGRFDSSDAKRFFYANSHGGVEFEVDWATGAAKPNRIYWLRSETPFFEPRWKGPEFPREIDGRRYVTNEFNGPTSGDIMLTVWADSPPGPIRPLFFIGSVVGWSQMEELGLIDSYKELKNNRPVDWARLQSKLLFYWNDKNFDGQPNAEEVQFRSFAEDESVGAILSTAFGDGYEILITHTKGVLSLQPEFVSKDGVPTYKLEVVKTVALNLSIPKTSGGGQSLRVSEDRLVVTGGPMYGIENGNINWTYASQWPGLHAGHSAPRVPEHPGQLIATTRLLGPLFRQDGDGSEALWAINSDKGFAYLLTSDGLFVDSLFEHPSSGTRWNVPEAYRGLDVTGFNYLGECFWPTITQFKDGKVVMVTGMQHSSVVRLDGLESIRRVEWKPVKVNEEQIAKAHRLKGLANDIEQAEVGDGIAHITLKKQPPVVDGDLQDWPDARWLVIDRGRSDQNTGSAKVVLTDVTMAVDSKNLYLAFRVRHDGKLLQNAGGDLNTLFATGGGVDIRLSTKNVPSGKVEKPGEGDVRLVISRVEEKIKAALFRAVVPGAADPIVYESPMNRIKIDEVQDVSDSGIRVAEKYVEFDQTKGEGKGSRMCEQIEISIPLEVLGWDPRTLPVTRGDIGVLIGDQGETTARSYWHNKSANIVDDIPLEADLAPGAWGPWQVK